MPARARHRLSPTPKWFENARQPESERRKVHVYQAETVAEKVGALRDFVLVDSRNMETEVVDVHAHRQRGRDW